MPDRKHCHQCGRIGTRQFEPYPDHSFDFGSLHDWRNATRVNVGDWGWRCANKIACRKRWPRRKWDDE